MDKQISIAIAGGGIAGVALASYLSKISHLDVCLYESAPQFSEIGAGISFGANAVHAIEQLGLADDYHAIADKVAAPHQDVWFQWRDGYTADYLSSSVAEGVGQSSVHRADFLDAIIKHIPAKNVQFSKKLQQITEVDDQVQLTFSDGTVATCDYLIGADGIHSVTRQYVLNSQGLDDVNPRFSGTWAYRGIIRYQDFRDALIALDQDVELADVPQMLLGQDKHILTFPIRNGELINIVAFKSDRNDLVLPEGTAWTKPVSAEQMLEDFADWHLGCRTLLELIEQPTIWALHEIEELSHYQSASSRVILMGDAAHAMLPHQGAGAGQGLEDAVILANLLETAALEHDHLNHVSTIYEQSRLQRACRVQRTSRESGEIYELCHPDYRSMQAVGEHLAHRFDWLWTYDLQAEIAQVKQQLVKQIESVDELA